MRFHGNDDDRRASMYVESIISARVRSWQRLSSGQIRTVLKTGQSDLSVSLFKKSAK